MPPIGNKNPDAPISKVFPAFPRTDPVPIHVAAIVPTRTQVDKDLPATEKSS